MDLQRTLQVFGTLSFLIHEAVSLSPPSYISPWLFMDSDDPATTFQTVHHGLGLRPIMVEVQVMSPTTGFIYPGVKSAFAGNDDNERGGVISVYDDNDIRLYGATNSGTLQGKAYIINTGVISWTSENQEQSTTGYVRVRVWLPNDLPSPSYTTTLNMKAGNTYWNDYEERSHGLGSIPVLTIVQYTPAWTVPLTGWVSEGTGSSSRPINNANLYWGGLVYGVDSQDIRLWAPSYGQANYGIFSFCDGWGYDVRGSDCTYIRASITIYMWTDLSAAEVYSHTELHQIGETSGVHEFSLFPSYSVDADNDIITVSALTTYGSNNGFQFYGTGAAMVDNADGCGGIVYAYSNVTSALRIWHPVGGSNNLIHVDGMGGGTYNQVADEADITLRLFKVFQSVINYCSFATEEPGINTITTLTSLADCCQATYACNPGYSLISGNLQRFYDYSLNTWNGTSPECQVATTSVNMCSSIDGGINTDVNLTSTNSGCLATYTCLPGYSLVSGDLFRSYDSLQSALNGTAPECHVLCSNPTSGTNSMYVLSSSQLLIGTLATYICTNTYVYEAGDYSRVCYGSGSWTGFPLNCSAPVTTTTILPPSTTSTGSVCFNFSTVVNITTVLRIADEIVANLTVPTKTTSKYTRSLTSAKDGRQSSTVIGLAGAGICAVIMGLLLVPDALTVLSFLVNKICSKRGIAD